MTAPTPPAFDGITLTTFDEPPAALLQAVDDGLERYNQATAPLADVRPLATVARGPTGQVLGGAVGRTWGACCELQQLWVDAEARGQGLGSALLRQFEQRAQARGCRIFYLTTLSYQAPDFYARLGYTTVACIAGYPQGIQKHLMHKVLADPSAAPAGG